MFYIHFLNKESNSDVAIRTEKSLEAALSFALSLHSASNVKHEVVVTSPEGAAIVSLSLD